MVYVGWMRQTSTWTVITIRLTVRTTGMNWNVTVVLLTSALYVSVGRQRCTLAVYVLTSAIPWGSRYQLWASLRLLWLCDAIKFWPLYVPRHVHLPEPTQLRGFFEWVKCREWQYMMGKADHYFVYRITANLLQVCWWLGLNCVGWYELCSFICVFHFGILPPTCSAVFIKSKLCERLFPLCQKKMHFYFTKPNVNYLN